MTTYNMILLITVIRYYVGKNFRDLETLSLVHSHTASCGNIPYVLPSLFLDRSFSWNIRTEEKFKAFNFVIWLQWQIYHLVKGLLLFSTYFQSICMELSPYQLTGECFWNEINLYRKGNSPFSPLFPSPLLHSRDLSKNCTYVSLLKSYWLFIFILTCSYNVYENKNLSRCSITIEVSDMNWNNFVI